VAARLRDAKVVNCVGGVISPLLANVFLHYVLDEWFAADVGPRMKKRHTLVRFCDDFVMAFEDFLDCRRVLAVLGKRVGRFGLTLHPDKTCMVDFRFRRPDGQRHPATQATTFDFLGFTHVWGKSRRGKDVIRQRTSKARYARALRAVHDWCKKHRHWTMPEQHARITRMMQGHFAYYGITGNERRLRWYAHRIECTWRMWLSKRTRGNQMRWDRFTQLLERYPLPRARIVHQYAVP
jgi:RNA-directed DNA polymerase